MIQSIIQRFASLKDVQGWSGGTVLSRKADNSGFEWLAIDSINGNGAITLFKDLPDIQGWAANKVLARNDKNNAFQWIGVVSENDSRLTNARIPLPHKHSISDIDYAVKMVNGVSPNTNGNIQLTPEDIGAEPSGITESLRSTLSAHTKLTTSAHGGIVSSLDARLSDARTPLDHEQQASTIILDTTNFNNNLTVEDTTVQHALETLDELIASSSSGDMLKETYDTNNNGKVDSAEQADSVPWSGVSGKPATFTPPIASNSVLGGIKVGANLSIDGDGMLSASGVGTHSHTESDLTLSDNTIGNVSTTKHGFTPKLPNDATKFLNGTGSYTVPATGGATVSKTISNNNDILAAGATYLVDTSGGSLNLYLPSLPANGDTIKIIDSNGTFYANNLTLFRNNQLISGLAEDIICDISGITLILTFSGDTKGWIVDFSNGSVITSYSGSCITQNQTITVGATGCNYTTLQAAFDSLSNVWIAHNATVTIQIQDGTYNSSGPIYLNSHPCGSRIIITGANTYAFNITNTYSFVHGSSTNLRANSTAYSLGATVRYQSGQNIFLKCTTAGISSSSDPGSWPTTEGSTKADGTVTWTIIPPTCTITFTVNSISNIAVGDYISIRNPSGGTNPQYFVGAGKITAIDSANLRITVDIYTAGDNFGITMSGATAFSCVGYKTVIDFGLASGSPAGIFCHTDITIQNMAIIGLWQATANYCGIATGFINNSGTIYVGQIVRTLVLNNILVAKFNHGIYNSGSRIVSQSGNITISACNGFGLYSVNNGHIVNIISIISGCMYAINSNSGSSIYLNSASYLCGNLRFVFYVQNSSFAYVAGVKIYGCYTTLAPVIQVLQGSRLLAQNITCYTFYWSTAAIQADGGSYIDIITGTFQQSPQTTPVANTVGGNNSYIKA